MQPPAQSSDALRAETATYARAVGSRLRALRHQMGLSLRDVEMRSEHEIKMSVLGSYERGDRIITVPRLQHLARIYDLPVDQLLPPTGDGHPARPETSQTGDDPSTSHRSGSWHLRRVAINLARLKDESGIEHALLRRFVNTIQLQRQDFNGRVITIRTGDLHVLASVAGVMPDAMHCRLDDLGLLVAT